ncbi:hypothetical protein QLH52_04080 [Methylomonas sp. OY6]|uniref:REase associating with pPIWI RE domain-containing protein n=1 Tax=Methylomonas defluvii TaxID=3045149 RepID=A0ABU4UBB9_9GAMM|nr:hypothetical protein [Methylomonas sp. OY6]MDX8126446.1 hypothetical protein [Methylomonas sp. OY6]
MTISAISSLIVPALAALVIRQARVSLIEGHMISGSSQLHGCSVGLSPEDRKAMALISRVCLVNGLPDRGSEIHDLLWWCSRPLGEWLRVPEITNCGLETTCLIQEEDGIPTAEAEELAIGFGGLTTGLEEQLFLKFMELLARFPEHRADQYYTSVREFVVRHPVVMGEAFSKLNVNLPSQIGMALQQFYEPVPESWQIDTTVPICMHCGNAMKKGKAGLVCRTIACTASNSAKSRTGSLAPELVRVTRGIRQYWIEPGLDEIRLYDSLIEMGLPVELYPFRDRVDIAVDDLGIDLKAYSSPETLGRRFNRNIGGLSHYRKKWVVVPDWLVSATPSYLDRLRTAMGRDDLICLTVSQAIKNFKSRTANA